MINDLFQQIKNELESNLLPFWLTYSPDPVHGGFVGALTNDLTPVSGADKGLILNARLLWTFSAAGRFTGSGRCRTLADTAFKELQERFWDDSFGGAYWSLRPDGTPRDGLKKTYGQGFFIYAMAEYYLLTHDPQALAVARELFELIEKHAWDDRAKGYLEVCQRNWDGAACQQLSEVDLVAPFSMNTHLHIMEAYMTLYSVWKEPLLRQRLRGLVRRFLDTILDADTGHFRLFFDADWQSQSRHVSYGHDIEGSWLLCRAAEILGEPALLAEVRQAAIHIAEVTRAEGLSEYGGLVYESDGDGNQTLEYDFWCQPEAVVGFINAFQLSRQTCFLETAGQIWQFVESHQVDRQYGEWFSKLNACLQPDLSKHKISEWKCPYHNIRACIEIMQRLETLRLEPKST